MDIKETMEGVVELFVAYLHAANSKAVMRIASFVKRTEVERPDQDAVGFFENGTRGILPAIVEAAVRTRLTEGLQANHLAISFGQKALQGFVTPKVIAGLMGATVAALERKAAHMATVRAASAARAPRPRVHNRFANQRRRGVGATAQ